MPRLFQGKFSDRFPGQAVSFQDLLQRGILDEGYGILKAVFLYGVDNVFADRRKIAGKE